MVGNASFLKHTHFSTQFPHTHTHSKSTFIHQTPGKLNATTTALSTSKTDLNSLMTQHTMMKKSLREAEKTCLSGTVEFEKAIGDVRTRMNKGFVYKKVDSVMNKFNDSTDELKALLKEQEEKKKREEAAANQEKAAQEANAKKADALAKQGQTFLTQTQAVKGGRAFIEHNNEEVDFIFSNVLSKVSTQFVDAHTQTHTFQKFQLSFNTHVSGTVSTNTLQHSFNKLILTQFPHAHFSSVSAYSFQHSFNTNISGQKCS